MENVDNRRAGTSRRGLRILTVILSFMMTFVMMPQLAGTGQASAADGCGGNGSWSEWTTTAPAAGQAHTSITQYRYRTRSTQTTTTSTNTSPGSGWVANGTSRSNSYGSWSDWNKTKPASYTYREIGTRTVTDAAAYTKYNWYYGEYYNNGWWYTYSVNYAKNHGGQKRSWSTNYMLTKGQVFDGYQSYKASTTVYHKGELWWLESKSNVAAKTHIEYRYRDKPLVYNWYKYNWSNWSSWQNTSVNSTATCEVQTRTLYSVWIPKAHKWDAGKVTKAAGYTHTGIKTFTCADCGAHKTQTIAKKNAKAVTPGKVTLSSAKAAKKKVTIKWSKVAKNIRGYQIAVKDKNTKKVQYIYVGQGSGKVNQRVINKLTSKHTYSIKVRAYNKIGTETLYGPWSNAKGGKVK